MEPLVASCCYSELKPWLVSEQCHARNLRQVVETPRSPTGGSALLFPPSYRMRILMAIIFARLNVGAKKGMHWHFGRF